MSQEINKKRGGASAMLHLKCPHCRQGNLFTVKNPFKLKTLSVMPDLCPVCNLTFNPEPGFYWGALYTSYALGVALAVMDFIIVYLICGWLVWAIMLSITLLLLLTAPLMFRYSRVLWIYICYYFMPGTLKQAK
ncbi:MAG: DUF983 domain-containing protein [Bacteroidota bacterium]